MSCRGFYHQVGNSRYSGRILPTLSSSYGRIIPTCERFFGAGWIYHLSSKTPSVYMPVWWDSSCFPTFLQNRAVYHPVRQYLMRGWQRTVCCRYCLFFFVRAPISRFFATFRDLFSGIIKILKDQEQLQIYTVVAASTSPLSGSGSITPVRLTAHHVYSQVQIMSPGFEFSYTQKIHGPL